MVAPHGSRGLTRRRWTVAVGVAGVVGPAVLRAQPRLRLRLAHVVAPDTPKGLMATRLQALLAQRSEGAVVLDVYPNGSLYSDADELEALQWGAVELLIPSLSKFGRLGTAVFELFDLPFLFADRAAVRRVVEGEWARELFEPLQRHGLLGLGFLDNGFKHMSARTHPLREPRDYRGLRMRVQPSLTIAAQMRALGAYPVMMDFAATRHALARGVVDGTENPLTNFWSGRMHEVQRHLTLSAHGYLGYAVVANATFWAHLPQPERRLIEVALADAIAFGNAMALQQEQRALQALRDDGRIQLHYPSPEEREALRQAMAPADDALAARIGPRWVRAMRERAQA
ncbi:MULTISPECIES: DctP family TRAP transporter solute-binding subunit [Burkholderiales]|uniref:C4-dicarboxylate-binding periplasmic protein DctP n=1 Tax=Tepidimonas taiwanensis TaxID=307486 RepID=A0A554WZD1_9BURK|nr:DctP family TRAP transporter solute-binding subunit [Tepidimonas taiwanensis]MCX7693863.1 DctP family TRAP transporter solute-binding subunit [Tepidimonas taiwanensis]MDM7462222.1 DctP family TRAP transporter solute-binding subunit [Tepidimonas taiwanensis]TSE28931.1 C4-dicarboxylate-binding periplasmic protein DctP [Tepidimonas taiwanensis]UBQ05230.1 DctP family TRAP transporter solute-binding subunit [Tepidimonas taiwanensis]